MADYNTTRETKADKDGILELARKRWDAAYERERSNIAAAYEDLEFLAGDQWDEKIRKDREDDFRPCHTVNQLPQFIHQVTGDIRQMKPSIKVVPVDDQADEKVAGIKGGLIRYIENRSDAASIYFGAADSQVGAGIGHWRVATEYADDSTFLQEIRIAPVDDGIAVLWDADARLPTREDGKYCFVPVDYSHDGFKEKWPDASISDFNTLAEWPNLKDWYTDSHVRIAEYWVKKPMKRTLALTSDGQTLDLTDEDEGLSTEQQVEIAKANGAQIEIRDSYSICRYLMTATEILEGPEEWPGRYIPIVPVIGEEVKIGRKVVRKGIVRDAKSVQQMYNYGRSMQTEVFSLQPKAPFMVTEINVAKYQDLWNTANKKNWPYLVFEPDAKNGGIAPQRIQPPVSSQGVNEAVELANEDMRRVIGIYDASLGAKSNETSGVAIRARQKEGDVGTFVYIANFTRAIRHTGKILIDLIPHVYDTQRTIRIMGDDGKIDMLKINQKQAQGGQDGAFVEQVMNDVTVGSYDVVAEAGPSYSTKREEARDGMLEFLKAIPTAAPLVADKIAKAQDFPMADDMAKRLRSILPPKIIQMEAMEKQGATEEQIEQFLTQQQEPPPDPAMVKIQADAEFKQAQLHQQQQTAMMTMQMQMQQMAEDNRRAQAELMASIKKMILESQTKIEIAQIGAGVGMHKNIIQAGADETQSIVDMHNAEQDRMSNENMTMHKTNTAAETARYQADNRPEPGAN